MFGQAKASFLVSNPREQRICTIGEAFRVSEFVNNPG
jgi:hypothetical protein